MNKLNFESSLFLIPLIAGSIFLALGLIIRRFPPKRINVIYGYKTPASMKSRERWDFSQPYAAAEMIRWGSWLSLSSVLGLLFNLREEIALAIGLVLTLLMIITVIARTERAIAKRFSKNQVPKRER